MTKDEYGDFVLRYKGCGACFPMYHTLSRFEKMWFTAIQKDITKLEKENAELKSIAENQQSSNMSKYFENKKLKEGLAVGSTFNKALNSMNKNLEEERDKYRNMVFNKDGQLAKAKEIIKKMKYLLFDVWGYIDISFEKNVNKFLSEVDK